MTQTQPLETALSARTEDSKNFKKFLMDQVRAGAAPRPWIPNNCFRQW